MKIKIRYLWKGGWFYIDFEKDNLHLKFKEFEERPKTKRLCLWTGLMDRQGKEIYEGDILKQGEGENETLIEIRFGNGTFDSGCYNFTGFFGVYLKVGFGGGFKKGDLCEDMHEITKEECERREVIGNIYENPEFEGKKDE